MEKWSESYRGRGSGAARFFDLIAVDRLEGKYGSENNYR